MSQPPAPFDRSWSFTDFSQSNPTTPHQGQKIDQELNNARTAINATISRLGEIQADDGKVRTTALNLAVIAEEVEPLLTDAPVQAVEAAGAQQIGLVNDAGDAKVAELEAVLTSQNAIDAIAARDDAEIAKDIAESSAILAQGYAGTAQGYANTALQAKNSALVHANTAEAAVATIQAANYASYHHTHAISNVTGLQSALDGKYSVNNPAGYITSSALTGYATQSWVNGRGFLTSVPAGYATESFVTSQGYLTTAPQFDGGTLSQGAAIDMSNGTTDSEVGGWGFGVELTGNVNQFSTVEYNQIRTKNAEYSFTATPTQVRVFEDTNNLGVTIAHDSIAIQHIETPDQTAYFTNEYIGFEDMGGTPHSAFIEHDVITVQNETANTAVRADSVIITQGDSTASLGISAVNFVTPIANGYIGPSELGIYDYVNNQTLTAGAAYVRLQTPGLDPGLVQPKADLTGSALNFQFEDEVPAATYAATGITFPDGSVQTTATVQGPQGDQGPQGQPGSNGNNGGNFSDVNYDSIPYIRINQSWQPLSSYDQTGGGGGGGGISDAPQDGQFYARNNGNWQSFTTSTGSIGEAPYNGTPYVRINNDWQPMSNYDQNSGGGGGIGEAPYNSTPYIRINGDWQPLSSYDQTGGGSQGPQGDTGPQGPPGNDGGYFSDAPYDNTSYVRINNSWSQTFRDFTYYNASGDPFYPYEVKITVNGSDYWMPIRPA